MKTLLIFSLLFSLVAQADTPAPGTVKAKMYTGDGVTGITATGTALNVNVTNSGGLNTVNQGTAGSEAWLVDGSNSTQPVSGTFWQATQPISAASLPLPSGASTSLLQQSLITALGSPFQAGGSIANTAFAISGTLPAFASTPTFNLGTLNGAALASKQPALGTAGTASSDVITVQGISSMTALKVDGSGVTQPVSGTVTANAGTGTFTVDGSGHTQPISAAALPLPSGAATEGTQLDVKTNTGATATSAASIDTKTPALGQALAAGSVPVVLPAAQISTLTPLSTITANAGSGTFTVNGSGFTQPVSGTFWQATQPVSGTVTANIGTSGSLALDSTVAGLQVSQGSTTSGEKGTLSLGAVTTAAPSYTTAQSSPFSLTTAGALRIDGSGSTQPVSGTFWQATQPVSGTFWQTTQPVSLATLPALTAGSALIGHVIVDTAPTTAVTGTFWQATQPVSIATAPALVASSAIIGKVGIDQTTPGTTNGVQVNAALPAGSNVIGHVIVDTAPSTAVTNAGTFAVQATPVVPAATTVKQAAITIGTSAVRLTTDGSAPSSTRTLLVAQLISTSTANCYFGSSGVTSSSTTRGAQMLAGQTFSFNNDAGDYYAICDTSSQTFLITEQE